MKIIIIFAATLLIAGCSSTGVIPMSQDSYFIGKKDGYPGLGISLSNKAEVYQEANAFCNKKNLEVKTLRENTKPARLGQLGSTELHFKCVLTGSTAQPLVREADNIIEIRKR